jgi:hypothetical protein
MWLDSMKIELRLPTCNTESKETYPSNYSVYHSKIMCFPQIQIPKSLTQIIYLLPRD